MKVKPGAESRSRGRSQHWIQIGDLTRSQTSICLFGNGGSQICVLWAETSRTSSQVPSTRAFYSHHNPAVLPEQKFAEFSGLDEGVNPRTGRGCSPAPDLGLNKREGWLDIDNSSLYSAPSSNLLDYLQNFLLVGEMISLIFHINMDFIHLKLFALFVAD